MAINSYLSNWRYSVKNTLVIGILFDFVNTKIRVYVASRTFGESVRWRAVRVRCVYLSEKPKQNARNTFFRRRTCHSLRLYCEGVTRVVCGVNGSYYFLVHLHKNNQIVFHNFTTVFVSSFVSTLIIIVSFQVECFRLLKTNLKTT